MTAQRYRNYCFTDFIIQDLETIYNDNKDIIRYLCFGREYCPKTMKEHQQGWVQFFNPKSLKTAQRILNLPKQHFEACKGNEYDNDKYCTKDGKYRKFGKFISQGQRTDLEEIKRQLDNGATIKTVADNFFGDFLRYHNGISKYKQLCDKTRSKNWRNIEVILICGPTDCGKTRHAMKEAKYKINASELLWWDGYEGEECICIDEYNNDIPVTKLLNLLDGYQLRLPIKGGFTYANWNKVFITSNLKVEELHAQCKEEHRNAMYRRISRIINLHDVSGGNTSTSTHICKLPAYQEKLPE